MLFMRAAGWKGWNAVAAAALALSLLPGQQCRSSISEHSPQRACAASQAAEEARAALEAEQGKTLKLEVELAEAQQVAGGTPFAAFSFSGAAGASHARCWAARLALECLLGATACAECLYAFRPGAGPGPHGGAGAGAAEVQVGSPARAAAMLLGNSCSVRSFTCSCGAGRVVDYFAHPLCVSLSLV